MSLMTGRMATSLAPVWRRTSRRPALLSVALLGLVLSACASSQPTISHLDTRAQRDAIQSALEDKKIGESLAWSGPHGTSGSITVLASVEPHTVGIKEDVRCRRIRSAINEAGSPINDVFCRAPLGFWVYPEEMFFLRVPATVKFGGAGGSLEGPSRSSGPRVNTRNEPNTAAQARRCNSLFRESEKLRFEDRISEANRLRRQAQQCLNRAR